MVTESLNEQILELINTHNSLNTRDLSNLLKVDHQRIVGAIKSLECLNDVITTKPSSYNKLDLTEEGEYVAKNGSHEYKLFKKIPHEGISQATLLQSIPHSQIGFSKAMSSGWLRIDKSDVTRDPIIFQKVKNIEDDVQKCLNQIKNLEIDDLPIKVKQDFKKRKLIAENVIKSFEVSKGANFAVNVHKEISDITADMINDGSWKNTSFKLYNFNSMGVPPNTGHFHPLMKVKTQFRQIFLEMGFTEMNTNKYVESSFWNFDALFQPQNHPARDEHDTFFMEDPHLSTDFPMDYLEKVKRVHTSGGFGSSGYNYEWKIEEAQKNILRTHTTANSARSLYKLAQEGFKPCKYFSIDKVYRNENLDATHLAEFHQIEGVIADYNINLGNLMGVLREFYKKLGISKIRFKPAYNPYTEPSMEVFSYHEGLKKWVEIGNSGIFRPELLLPMGLPPDISVIAWGLSLERPTMILYGISNIRELVGHKVNLQMVYESPICFFK